MRTVLNCHYSDDSRIVAVGPMGDLEPYGSRSSIGLTAPIILTTFYWIKINSVYDSKQLFPNEDIDGFKRAVAMFLLTTIK
jgi:hypothetical protein